MEWSEQSIEEQIYYLVFIKPGRVKPFSETTVAIFDIRAYDYWINPDANFTEEEKKSLLFFYGTEDLDRGNAIKEILKGKETAGLLSPSAYVRTWSKYLLTGEFNKTYNPLEDDSV